MTAVFKRELKAYFSTPIGYIFLAAFYFFLGLFFYIIYTSGSTEIGVVLLSMSTISVFAIPIITMRLMSDDRRQKVDQALITAPVKLSGIVLGKFFAALALYALAFVPTVFFELIILSKVSVSVLPYIYSLLGIILLGAALISIGMFISCLTESPVISAILTLVINILVLYMANFTSMITVPTDSTGFFGKIWQWIVSAVVIFLDKAGFITVANKFIENVFSVSDIIYFISIIAIFVFLSVRSLEKRRWS